MAPVPYDISVTQLTTIDEQGVQNINMDSSEVYDDEEEVGDYEDWERDMDTLLNGRSGLEGEMSYESALEPNTILYGGTERKLRLQARDGNVGGVMESLQKRVRVNATCDQGWTACMRAASEGHLPIVRILHEHGANLSHVNLHNCSASWQAKLNQHWEVGQFIGIAICVIMFIGSSN
jgi:hypothetical protein